jgi:hypothetical protein
MSVPYQCRPCAVRHRNIVTCILNGTIHTYPAHWTYGTDTALIRNWHGTDKCESTFTSRVLSKPLGASLCICYGIPFAKCYLHSSVSVFLFWKLSQGRRGRKRRAAKLFQHGQGRPRRTDKAWSKLGCSGLVNQTWEAGQAWQNARQATPDGAGWEGLSGHARQAGDIVKDEYGTPRKAGHDPGRADREGLAKTVSQGT